MAESNLSSIIGMSTPIVQQGIFTTQDLSISSVGIGSGGIANGQAIGDTVTIEAAAYATEIANNNKAANTASNTNKDVTYTDIYELYSDAQTYNINNIYDRGQGRLLQFTYNNGGDDANKRAYLKLGGHVQAIKETLMSTAVSYNQLMSIYNQLISGYKAFILLNIQENLQEKQLVLPTVGDSYSATFSGAEPQVLSINGILPFDNQSDRSWFVHFMNMYVSFIRASVLAKARCWLQLVVPDYQTYKCFPISITYALDANSDTSVQFGMSCVVMNDWAEKAYGYTAAVYNAMNLDEATFNMSVADMERKNTTATANTQGTPAAQASAEKQSDIQSGNSKSVEKVSDAAKKRNIVDSANEAIKKTTNSVGDAMKKETSITVNGKKQTVGQVGGAILTGISGILGGGKQKGRGTIALLGSAMTAAGENTSGKAVMSDHSKEMLDKYNNSKKGK